MVKRVFLFMLTNLMVIATISLVLNILGVHHYLQASGINVEALLLFCLIWGMGGSFISLFLSKWMAKMAMGVEVIDPRRAVGAEAELVDMVYRLARQAGLSKMPEVGIYDSPEVNAFATGPSRNNSLVAVSTGLLHHMNRDEVEGVLGHEVAHIANGDMVTMTLLQGIINAFVMFLSRVLAYVISMATRSDEEESGFPYVLHGILVFVFDILFTILGSLVVAWFSRYREYRADAGGARLAGKGKMIAALRRLKDYVEQVDNHAPSFASMKISNKEGILALFSTHPPLEKRIERLMQSA
ncbi:MAG: protease HtpX [Leptospiraceae bacterium]|nr:protease HtpX [Leptospiraceae bacterium]